LKQEYILLRKENNLLNSLIGQSFNQRTKNEADKILNEIHKQADRYCMEKAICYVMDKGEIKGVGGSSLMQNEKTGEIVSDLILNNFGLWLSKIFSTRTTANQSFTGVNSAGGNTPIHSRALTSNVFNITSGGAVGINLAVGAGSTPPARTDFTLETFFGTAPESLVFVAGFPVYNSGLGTFKNVGSIIAGGSGTINESVLFNVWRTQASGLATFAQFRDIISPSVSFIAGQSILLEYTVQI